MDQETVNVLKKRIADADKRYKPCIALLEGVAKDLEETLIAATGVRKIKVCISIHTHSLPVFKNNRKDEGPVWIFGGTSPYASLMPVNLEDFMDRSDIGPGLGETRDQLVLPTQGFPHPFQRPEVPIRMDSALRAEVYVKIKHGQVTVATIPDLRRLTPDIAAQMKSDIHHKLASDDQITTELLIASNNGYGYSPGPGFQEIMMKRAMDITERQLGKMDEGEEWRKRGDDEDEDEEVDPETNG